MKALLTFLVPALFIDLFLGGALVRTTTLNYPASAALFILESLLIVVIAAVIHVYSPRFRVDQAFKWFSKFPLVLGLIAIVWAYAIKIFGVL
jgi:NADH-quinone oxidoreductase subunit H